MNSKILNITLLLVVGFLFQGQVYSQDMYVKADSFVYASNQYVYIKNDLELNGTSSNFYLRNDGQLLQGTTAAGANKGVGTLSVFQEGSVNSYQYNYWCSPVGNVTSSAINNPFGISLLGRPTTVTDTTPVSVLGSNVYDGTASPFAIAPYWIYKFTVKSSYSDWVFAGSNHTINAGQGFTMKGTSGTDATIVNGIENNSGDKQRYDFRGKPNDGTINIAVLPEELTLTGNPYPSAIDLRAFLLGELNCTGIAYFWEHDKTVDSHYLADYKGGYGTYSSGADEYSPAVFYTYDGSGNEVPSIGNSGHYFERRYAPIGQGFMIEGVIAPTEAFVQMKNSYRKFVKEGEAYESEFEKTANNKTRVTIGTRPKIRFNTLLDNGPVSQMILVFDPSSTDDVDRAMDAASPNDGPANNYFVINNYEYIIAVMPFDIDKKIPIGFRNYAEANYKITVNEMLNIPEVTEVYLHDKTTDTYHDIKNSFYDLTLPAGTYNTRFEITFRNGTLGVVEAENKDFVVRQDNANKSLVINNPLQLDLATCSVYDVVGRLIFTKNKLGTNSSYTFETSDLSNGIYIVKLSTKDKTKMGQKIIVKN